MKKTLLTIFILLTFINLIINLAFADKPPASTHNDNQTKISEVEDALSKIYTIFGKINMLKNEFGYDSISDSQYDSIVADYATALIELKAAVNALPTKLNNK